MSSSDRRWARPIRTAALLLLAGGLAACTVRPVYMSASGSGSSGGGVGQADLSSIAVSDAFDRVGQQVRNNLIFLFTGGRPPAPVAYTLDVATTSSEVRLGFEKDETAPAYQVTVAVRYELKEVAGGRSIQRSIANGVASYDRSNQNFANIRARIDAENRAAQAVAEQINLRLSIALAKEKAQPLAAPVAAPAPASLPAASAKSG